MTRTGGGFQHGAQEGHELPVLPISLVADFGFEPGSGRTANHGLRRHAYAPEGKAVHYICVTSMGEVHDHKGRWKDGMTVTF